MNLNSLKRRLQMMLSMGVIKRVNETTALQQVQISQMEGELRDKRENYQPYGFAHYPRAGAEGITLSHNGDRGHIVVINIADRKHRLKLNAAGEVALYDDQDQWVWLKRDGIEINTDKKVTINAPTTYINGKLIIDGVEFMGHGHGGVKRGASSTDGVNR